MKVKGLLVVFGAVVASGAPVVAQAAGTAERNLTTAGVAYTIAADDTSGNATATTVAQLDVTPGVLALLEVPNLHFETKSVQDVVAGGVTLTDDAGAVTNDAPGWDGTANKLIRVSDYRGNNAGWSLSAALGDFTNADKVALVPSSATIAGDVSGAGAKAVALTGANFGGNGATLLHAPADDGTGEITATVTNATVALDQNLKATPGAYRAAINWTLAATPMPQ